MPIPSHTLRSPCCGTGAPWLGAPGQCGQMPAVSSGKRCEERSRAWGAGGAKEEGREKDSRNLYQIFPFNINFISNASTGKLIPSELQLTYFRILSLKFNVQIKRLMKFMFCFEKQKTRLVEVTHPPRWNTTLPSAHFCNPFGLSEAEWWCKSHVAKHQTSGRPS